MATRRGATIVILILMSGLLAALAAGCGIGTYTPPQPAGGRQQTVRLTLLHNWTGQDAKAIAMRRILNEFRTAHPDVRLEDVGLPTDVLKVRLRTLAAADEMPDLFVMWPGSMTTDFVKGGLLQPVNDLLDGKPEWRDRFIPHAFDGFTVNGGIYSVPMNLAPTSILYYNQELFDRYGVKVPETWEEMQTAVRIFNEHRIIPIALGNKANWVVQSTIFSTLADRVTGSDWFMKAVNQKGARFTDPPFIDALKLLQNFGKTGAFPADFNLLDDYQMMQLFFDGKAAMFFNGGWATSYIVQNMPKEALAHTHVGIMPSIAGGKGEARSVSGVVGTGLGVNKRLEGAEREAALDLFYALSGPEGQKATLDSSTLTSYDLEPDRTKANPLFLELYDLIGSVKLSPVYDVSLSLSATEAINSGLQEVLLGGNVYKIAQQLQDTQAAAMSK
ncbi:extracellular solute-binding protein [Cohnella zeiphila]|uniref:Extracellular solute-binding protein n=1 Tax=Cohnella zeiphila TaxID=2761120 RepID=A0A7X0VW09_9BACL|nr:extracellular solute-binding protein [Cohnella zeiphila]MBB6732471.1 extracellular solute-binding protein [Cohnella zeiphila]